MQETKSMDQRKTKQIKRVAKWQLDVQHIVNKLHYTLAFIIFGLVG